MRKLLAAVPLVLLVAAIAYATDPPDRPSLSEREVIIGLNGSPIALGCVSTDGGVSANNWTTNGTKFDAGVGDLVMSTCNFDHYMQPGLATASASSVSTPIAANEKVYTFLLTTENAIAFFPADAGLWGRCCMQHVR